MLQALSSPKKVHVFKRLTQPRDFLQAMRLNADGAPVSQSANHASTATSDLFGGLDTAQLPHSRTLGNGNMFGGLSLGSGAQNASSAPPIRGPKQAQPAAALDSDLFGGSLNGQSSLKGIPQQVRDSCSPFLASAL
jgi:hypothetical protein